MAYSTAANVKTLLNISTSTHDTLIGTLIDDADDWIDTQLRPWVSVPMGSPPDLIIAASKWMAAGFFIQVRPGRHGTEDARGKDLVDAAKEMVKEYLQGFYTGQESPGSWDVAITSAGERGAIHSLESEYVERDSI